MTKGPGRSFPRLAFGGRVVGSGNIAVMPSSTVLLSEHGSIFGSPQPYFFKLHHLKKQLSESELHGRGGAAFPLSRKLAGYEPYRGKLIVVANGSEGEYLSRKDEQLIARHPHLVLDGLSILGSALDSKAGYVHVKASKTSSQRILQQALSERKGLDPFRIEISLTAPDVGYVAGSESAVVSAINHQGGLPIYSPDRPMVRGVKKRPTLIANVETLAHLALLARFGSGWFSSIGSAGDSGTRLLTVSLPNRSFGVIEVVAGTEFSEIFESLGASPSQISCGLLGGYFGQLVDTDKLWSLRASHAFLKEAGFALGAGVIALADGCPIGEISAIIEYLASQSAGQCGPCYRGLPELANTWRELASGRVNSKSLSRITDLCDQISGRGGCAMPDGAVLLARTALSRFRPELLDHQSGSCNYAEHSSSLVPPAAALAGR
ncbi:MAG: NADH-quinone oxidoreductase subunit F [Actinomycetota bacterium]|nr:NADH-quinone oxidoreductase subunit F [Actinomycetota bacterium]